MLNNIDVMAVAARCLHDEAAAVESIVAQLDDSFEQAVALMLRSTGRVIVTGVGKSGHVAAKIAATLASTGTPAFCLNPLDAFHGDLGMLTADDVVLALSNSGQTDELLRLVPYIKEHSIPLIGISGNADSLLARHADIHIRLHIEHEACPLNLAPTSSTTAQLALGDALAIALMQVRHFEATDFAQFHPGGSIGRRLLTTAHDVMRTEDLPVISPEASLTEAVTQVSRSRLGLVVPVEEGKVVGILTDGDVRRAMETLQQQFFHTSVRSVMTHSPKCVPETMKITQVQAIMHRCKIHAVLVTDPQGQLIGIVDSFSCML